MTTEQQLIEFWIGKFHAIGEPMIPFFVNCTLPHKLMLSRYKTLPPIEEMAEKEKQEMWKYVNDLFPTKTKEEKISCAKIIYTIGMSL